MPVDLSLAIEHANRIIDWQENLASDEMPPEWMWPLDDEIVEWMERVAEERKEKYGGSGDDDHDSGGPMTQNEYARDRR